MRAVGDGVSPAVRAERSFNVSLLLHIFKALGILLLFVNGTQPLVTVEAASEKFPKSQV